MIVSISDFKQASQAAEDLMIQAVIYDLIDVTQEINTLAHFSNAWELKNNSKMVQKLAQHLDANNLQKLSHLLQFHGASLSNLGKILEQQIPGKKEPGKPWIHEITESCYLSNLEKMISSISDELTEEHTN